MSTTTKNVGRVSIVPKGDWNINNTYIRLDLVTYDGNSYIAKKDVPKNIQLSNNNYWMLIASKGAQGAQGAQGEQGAPFAIMKSYASIAAMNADFSNTDVQNGQFVIIDTGNVQDPDNAKLYYKGSNNYVFVTDMSGAAGIQGPRGASAYEQAVAGGYEGTEAQFNEDLADFKELSEQAASSATAADNSAKDAEAYAIGKRGGTDVESTDPTYHNNAKYYSEQAALIVDDVEQVMTSTTIGPTAFATFDASVASMPLKGLTADIEPVQNFNGYSRPWLGGAGKNQLSLSMSFLYEKNTSGAGTWTNNQYVSNGVTFEVQLNNNNDVIGIKVNGTASANTDFVFIERAPVSISGYPLIENGCPSGGSNNTYRITTRVYHSDFGVTDYYDYGSGLNIPSGEMFESFSSQIRIFSGYTASNLIFRPMIRFQFDEDETFEPYSNICPITGWTGCKLHHTGVSLIGGDAFIGNSFSKTANGYQLSYNGSSISNRASVYADISGIPAGRYTLIMLNPSYPTGAEVNIRRRTAGSAVTMGTIISSAAFGRRIYDIPENTTSLQLYIIPDTMSLNTSITMDDIVLVREADDDFPEPYKGNIYNITFPSEIGTVYGGTLDVVNKKLTVTKKYALLNDPDKWSKTGINIFQYSDQFSDRKRYGTFLQGFLCSCANTSSSQVLQARWAGVDTDYFCFSQFSPSNDNILDKIKTAAANNKIAILYDLAEPLVYDITAEQVATLLGENNIWADIGDVTVTYGAYLETIKTYADQAVDSAAAAETAQDAAEDAQAAAEAVLASIPSDYTTLSGDVDNLKSAVDKNNSVNTLDNVAVSTSTTAGITFSVIDKQTIHVEGTSTSLANKDIYSSQTMPEWLEKGKQYYLEYSTPSENVLFRVYIYRNGTLVSTALVEAVSNQIFTIPTDATGIIFRLAVKKSLTVNENVTFAVLNAKSNLQLTNNIENLYHAILTTNSADAHNETINLLNPNTITEGYILSNNKPVVNSGFYYSDYIEIGMNKFCHSQAGTISAQVNCYDGNKNFIGIIDTSHNTDHYTEGNVGQNNNLRFRTFTPLDGTVYIRVNGGMSRPKMITPFFSPMDYGASAQNLPYGKIFRKYGKRVAMFGDSITLGTNGNGGGTVEKNLSFYLESLTGWVVENYGVGSQGWVSTRYTDTIAYDKISTTDLSSYDIITLCYGVNDTGATLGDYDSTDEATVCGQINKCINYILTQNNKAIVILIAPFNTAGNGSFPDWRYPVVISGWSRAQLAEKEKEIAAHYHIPFISQDDSPFNGYGISTPDGTRTNQFIGTDNVHPTPDGYKVEGHWLTAKIKSFVY